MGVVIIGSLGEEEISVFVEQEVAHVLLQICHENSTIPVVSDSASVHGLPDQILQRTPRNSLILVLESLGQVHVKQLIRNGEVALVEVIRYVPADLSVLTTVLDDGMEEGNHEHKGFEGLVRAFV